MAKLAKRFTPKKSETIITSPKKRLSFASENANEEVHIRSSNGARAERRSGAWRNSTNSDHLLPGHYGPGPLHSGNDITSASGGYAIEIQASDVNLDLNGHTINATLNNGVGITFFPGTATPVNNVRVTNGAIVAAGEGIKMYGSYCMVSGLTITTSFIGIAILQGQFNHVANCVLIGVSTTPGPLQHARTALMTTLASNNAFQNCTLEGIFTDTIVEDDQAGSFATVVGNNTWTDIQFAQPTQ